jgi:hypothetical protein
MKNTKKIYIVFNHQGTLLSAFTAKEKMFEYIRRHKFDQIQIKVATANSWNETEGIVDDSKYLINQAYFG